MCGCSFAKATAHEVCGCADVQMWEGRLFAFVGDNPQQRRKILNYRYSSAGFYATGHDEFGLMTILAEWRGAYCPVRNTGFVGDNTNKGEKDGYGGHA